MSQEIHQRHNGHFFLVFVVGQLVGLLLEHYAKDRFAVFFGMAGAVALLPIAFDIVREGCAHLIVHSPKARSILFGGIGVGAATVAMSALMFVFSFIWIGGIVWIISGGSITNTNPRPLTPDERVQISELRTRAHTQGF